MLRLSRKSSPAFTLLELLVVTAIIGLLVAVTFPSLSKARARAKKIACGAALHGLAVGVKSYLSDFNDRYPCAAEMPSINTSLPALPAALKSYVTTGNNPSGGQPWRCPADTTGYVRSDNQSFDSYFAGEALSFEYNMSLGGIRAEQDFLFPLIGIQGIFVMADFDTFHGPKGQAISKNILFADGHVGNIDDISHGH